MKLSDRFNERNQLNYTQKKIEDPEILAGRMAEKFLADLVDSNLRYKGANCFLNKRVPSREDGRRYEVDLMVLTKKQLNIIEVKNWSGHLFISDGKWKQQKRNGYVIEHTNVLKYFVKKKSVIVKYLKEKGIDLPPDFISHKVILINNNLAVSRDIQKNPDVITRDGLNDFLRSRKGAAFSEECSIQSLRPQ